MKRSTRLLPHVKTQLALHELRSGSGRPLLLLHSLGGRTPVTAPALATDWPGPIYGLDFTDMARALCP